MYAGPRNRLRTGRPPGRTFGVTPCLPVTGANSLHFGPTMARGHGHTSFRKQFEELASRMTSSMWERGKVLCSLWRIDKSSGIRPHMLSCLSGSLVSQHLYFILVDLAARFQGPKRTCGKM